VQIRYADRIERDGAAFGESRGMAPMGRRVLNRLFKSGEIDLGIVRLQHGGNETEEVTSRWRDAAAAWQPGFYRPAGAKSGIARRSMLAAVSDHAVGRYVWRMAVSRAARAAALRE